MLGSLLNLRKLGFLPKTVIDVGAALGTFPLLQAFPESRHILIEPIRENEPYLKKLCSCFTQAEYIIAAATSQSKKMKLVVNPNLVHSSVQETSQASTDRDIECMKLDDLARKYRTESPYLIKIDVDGKEVDVILGAEQVLKNTEYIIIESTTFGQMQDVIDMMNQQGFSIYDIVNLSYRPSDMVLWQVDIAFVKANGFFRKERGYLPSQNSSQDTEQNFKKHMQSYRNSHIEVIDEIYKKHVLAHKKINNSNHTIF